jgi:hypothetical protein
MGVVKIQYEQPFPASTFIGNAVIGRTQAHYSEEFFEALIPVVEGPVKAARSEALVIITLHSPFMWAAHLALHKTLEDAYPPHNKRAIWSLLSSRMYMPLFTTGNLPCWRGALLFWIYGYPQN